MCDHPKYASRFPFRAARAAFFLAPFALAFVILLAPAIVRAKTPTQNDVFKSIQDNVNQSEDASGQAIPWICAGVGLIVLLAIFSKRQTRQATPKPLNNPHRLTREVMRLIPLKPSDVKQLKTLADETSSGDKPSILHPLVLLLCPSVIEKAVLDNKTRADRRTLVSLLKKLER